MNNCELDLVLDDGSKYFHRCATIAEAEVLAALEAECFPADEACDLCGIQKRLSCAGRYFHVLESSSKEMIGFINGTCTNHSNVHHDSMSTHDVKGRSLVIHSGETYTVQCCLLQ